MQSGAALARLFNGGLGGLLSGAATGPLTLGGFAFADMELPEGIQCGGQQQVAAHQLPGGGRIVDAMGPSEAPITWSGIFLGPDAATRSQQLSEMRRAGQVVPLAWGGTVVPVIVTEVLIDWRNPHWVPYRISCDVLPPLPAKGADADDEDADLADMDDEDPEGGILGSLADAAGDVGGVLTDVANEAGRIVGIAQGALSAVSGVVGPVTAALGIQVPFLSTMQSSLGLLSGLTSFAGSAGAGLSGLGGQYGTQALAEAGSYNAGQFNAADEQLDAFDGSGVDVGATPGTLRDQTDAARDTALGASTGGALNSAQAARRASATKSPNDSTPASPVPPSGGASVPAAAIGDPSVGTADAPATAPPPAAVPDVTAPPVTIAAPGNATAPAASRFPSDAAAEGARRAAVTATPEYQAELANLRNLQARQAGGRTEMQRLVPLVRADGSMSEAQIKAKFDQAGRPDLYRPPGSGS